MKSRGSVFISVFCLLLNYLQGTSAIGENRLNEGECEAKNFEVSYLVDRDADRTTYMIRDGKLNLTLESAPGNGQNDLFLKMSINLQVAWYGPTNSTHVLRTSDDFGSKEFRDYVKKNGTVTTSAFSIQYLETVNVTLDNERQYSDCDVIEMFNISSEEDDEGNQSDDDINDVFIKAFICDGVSGIGATKIDISATSGGIPFKVGFNLQHDE